MHMSCPACGATLGDDDAACTACAAVPEKPTVAMPRGFALRQADDELIITRSWLSLSTVGMLALCLVWDGLIALWYAVPFNRTGVYSLVVLPLLPVVVGGAFTYSTLAGFVNRTIFRVTRRAVAVTHYPLWWPGSAEIPADSIEQLFCDETVYRTKRTKTITYNVHVVLEDGKRLPLVTGLEDSRHARFIEQEVEAHLGIPDRPMHGELPQAE